MTRSEADLAAPEPPERGAPAASDRGFSLVGGRRSRVLSRALPLGALIVGGGILLAASWGDDDRPAGPQTPAAEPPSSQNASAPAFEPARRSGDTEPLPMLSGSDDAGHTTDAVLPGGRSDLPTADADQEAARRALAEAAQRAPVLAWSARPQDPARAQAPLSASPSDPSPASTLDGLRRSGAIARVRASVVGDRSHLLLAGTAIPCLLETAIDSALPGYVRCIVPSDVWSANGAMVLIERGAQVLGEYASTPARGGGRLFVVWNRAVTPAGVSVSLASPAADAMGRSGVDGVLDTHFWTRFGAALMFSLVDEGTAAAAPSRTAPPVTRLPSDAASVALDRSIDLPPTLRLDQGAELTIMTAQDLDFSEVYRLALRAP